MLILVFEVIVQPPKHTFEIGFFPILGHCVLHGSSEILTFDKFQNPLPNLQQAVIQSILEMG